MKSSSKGFTLVELLVTIAILAILATIAAPSMMNMIRNNQLSQQSRDFVAVLNEARAKAITERRDTYTLKINDATAGGESLLENTKARFAPDSAKVQWSKKDQTEIGFNFMGTVTNISNDECFLLEHKADSGLKQAIIITKSGSIQARRGQDTCPN